MSEQTAAKTPAFTVTEEQRTALFDIKHPAYVEHVDSWQMFLDAYDGVGGFLDGSYLDKYPREEATKFTERQKKARYHNYLETIVDLYVRKIFSQKVKRDTTDEGLKQFWEDVTGGGVSIDTFMATALTKALAAGHAGILCDKTRELPTGPALADEKARPFLTQYLPTQIQDWRTKEDQQTLTMVKLREAKPSTDFFSEHATGDDAVRMLVWTDTIWARVEREKEKAIETAVHALDLVPFTTLVPKPLTSWTHVGKSLFGNANILKALYNRGSEEDEVLRDQAFSLLTVNVPVDGDVEKVKGQIGSDMGTTTALVLQGEAEYITPDTTVADSIRKNIGYLVQEIYRMAHMRFQRDSLEAETAEALQLKHDELNATLAAIAEACQACELAIARFYFAWTSTTSVAAEAAFEKAKVNVAYATEFFLQDLETDLKAWVLAIKQQLGKTMEKRTKMRIVKRLEPELDQETLDTIEKEVEALVENPPEVIPGNDEHLRQPGRIRQLLEQGPPTPGAPGQPQPGQGAAA